MEIARLLLNGRGSSVSDRCSAILCRALCERRRGQRTSEKESTSLHPHYQCIAHPGPCGKPPVVPHNRQSKPKPTERGVTEMHLLIHEARGNAEPTGVMPT